MQTFIINFILLIGLAHVSLSVPSPQWTGTFQIDNSCYQAECCCLADLVTISKASDEEFLVSSKVAGEPCQAQLNGSTSITALIPVPKDKDGYQITTTFLGSLNRFTLSENSQYIVSVNLNSPKCSDSAHRANDGINASSMISSILLFFLINTLLFHKIYM